MVIPKANIYIQKSRVMPAEVEDNTHQNDDILVPLRSPYNPGLPNNFNRYLLYSGYFMLLINMVILVSIIAMVAPMSPELHDLLSDSHDTITDLKIMMPEMEKALQILNDFCKMDEFRKYCPSMFYDTLLLE